MKMTYETKQKMALQRERRVKEFFYGHGIGSDIYLTDESSANLICAHVLMRNEYRGEYYYVLGTAECDIFIGKVVYTQYVDVIKVPEDTKKYKDNKEVFECWINQAKQRIDGVVKSYYESYFELYDGKPVPHKIIIWNNGTLEDATFRMKKEFDNKYYFVVKLRNGNYAIAQIGWENGIICGIILTDKEFEDNKEVFKSWITQARKNDLLGRKND